ncbi:MAG: TIGR03435 family protein [Vicinamibacterales bacterium]
MRTVVLCVVLLAASAMAAAAQDLSGQWQGTLQAGGRPLRLVFRVTNGDNGPTAVMLSIDQGSQPVAAAVSVDGTLVRFSIAAIAGGFEGRLSADGSTLNGTWGQGGGSLPLTLERATAATAWAIPETPAALRPMAADLSPAFEVASIRPAPPNAQGKGFLLRGRAVTTVNTTVRDLMAFAYGVHAEQISGLPDWATRDAFDIAGPPDAEGLPNERQMRGMVQKILADRFKLAFHRDMRELSAYALVRTDVEPRLTRSAAGANATPALIFRGLGVLPAANATMADLASVMQYAVLDRPVVDRTGLEGRYDFLLRWTPDESQFAGLGVRVPPPSNDPAAPPGLFTAIQEQLGLKFESTRASVDVIVVDQVERPSPN